MTRFMPLPGDDPGYCPSLFGGRAPAAAPEEASHTSDSPLLREGGPANRVPSSASGSTPPVPTGHCAELCSGVDTSERFPGDLNGRLQHLGPRFRVFKWAAPCCLLFVSLLIQNFGLYWATYKYVTRMDRLEASLHAPVAAMARAAGAASAGDLLDGWSRRLRTENSTNSSLDSAEDVAGQTRRRPLRGAAASRSPTAAPAAQPATDAATSEDEVQAQAQASDRPANGSSVRPSRRSETKSGNASEALAGSVAVPGAAQPKGSKAATPRPPSMFNNDREDSSVVPSWRFPEEAYNAALEDPLLDLASHRSAFSRAAVLDVLSGMVPILFLAFALLTKDLRIWTKCCLCGSLLALLKAFLSYATVVPDSAGWEGCKERLGPDGLRYFLAEDRLSFKSQFLFGVGDVLRLDVLGVWLEGSESRHPFCADMMFSGHAYFCAVFSLGLYDLARKCSAPLGLLARAFCRFLVGSLLLLLMCCDVELIMASRIHYTMDIVIALVLSLLLFSSPAVAAATEYWAVDLDGERGLLESSCSRGASRDGEKDLGDLLVPPCCFPLCCFPGRYHLSGLPDRKEVFERELGQLHDNYGAQMRELEKTLAEMREELRLCDEERQRAEALSVLTAKRAKEEKQAREEQHAREMDALSRSLALEKSKTQELEKSVAELRGRLLAEEERHEEELRALRAQLDEETVSRKRFEERSNTLAQVLVTRENERQEAAALLLGARGARTGGDALEQAAAALVAAGLSGFDSPVAKPPGDGELVQGACPAGDAAAREPPAEGPKVLPGEDAAGARTEESPPGEATSPKAAAEASGALAPELSTPLSDVVLLESTEEMSDTGEATSPVPPAGATAAAAEASAAAAAVESAAAPPREGQAARSR